MNQTHTPWTKAEMQHEPKSHRDNKPINEVLFSSCYDQNYDLTRSECIEWWNLRLDLYPLFDKEDENCMRRLKGLWQEISDEEFQARHVKWTEIGFQQVDPTTDFRGGGVQSLDDLIHFVQEHKGRIPEMTSNDFYFAASSINVTFFLKKYFHLLDTIDHRDKHEIANRVAFKNFCHLLVEEDNLWTSLHHHFLIDLFEMWVHLRKTKPGTTILDFGIVQDRMKQKIKDAFSNRLYSHYSQLIHNYVNNHVN